MPFIGPLNRFPKLVELYRVLSMYGNNIIALEGKEWKQTKKIVAPAFSEVSLQFVPLNQIKQIFFVKAKQQACMGHECPHN